MKQNLVVIAACAALMGLGCDSDPDPVDSGTTPGTDSGPPPPGVDSGPLPMTDAGFAPTGTGFARQRIAFDRLNAALCACNFADNGFASASECEAFGDLTETTTCQDMAFATAGAAANPSFDCLAPRIEAWAACVEGASCDATTTDGCDDAVETAAMACMATAAAYTSALDSCIASMVVGVTPSTCPENATASSAVGAEVFTGTTLAGGNDHAGTCDMTVGDEAPDRVFEWMAPAAGTYDIDTNGSSFDTALIVLDACTGGTELACNDDAEDEDIGLRSRVSVTVTAGQTIFIVVDGYNENAGEFDVNINLAAATPDGGVPDGGAALDAGVDAG